MTDTIKETAKKVGDQHERVATQAAYFRVYPGDELIVSFFALVGEGAFTVGETRETITAHFAHVLEESDFINIGSYKSIWLEVIPFDESMLVQEAIFDSPVVGPDGEWLRPPLLTDGEIKVRVKIVRDARFVEGLLPFFEHLEQAVGLTILLKEFEKTYAAQPVAPTQISENGNGSFLSGLTKKLTSPLTTGPLFLALGLALAIVIMKK